MALSLKDYGIGEFRVKSLDEVVAFIDVIGYFSVKGKLVECGNVFGEFSFSLMEIYELCHCCALGIYWGKCLFEFFYEFIPSAISVSGLLGDVCVGSRVQGLCVIHEVF